MANNQSNNVAHLRKLQNSRQCELSFVLKLENPEYGKIEEEIRAVRQITDTIYSLLTHIRNKVNNIIQKNQNPTDEPRENLENDIPVFFKRKSNIVRDDTLLNFIKNICMNVSFNILGQKYSIVLNSPLVTLIKLPTILYVNSTIKPTKFTAVHTDVRKSKFIWYRSLDKENWIKGDENYHYEIDIDDTDHYLKLVCIPQSEKGLKGSSFEVVSENKVECMMDLPQCPYEKRHEFTLEDLKGKEFRIVSYNILSEKYTYNNFEYCSERVLAIDYRKQLIWLELNGYHADILCLQEVDDRIYKSYFKNKFKEVGFGSVYNRKGNRIPEGLAVIFNKSKFHMVNSRHVVLSELIQENKFSYLWDALGANKEVSEEFLKQSTSLQVNLFELKEPTKNKEKSQEKLGEKSRDNPQENVEEKSRENPQENTGENPLQKPKEKVKKSYVIVANTHLFYHPDATHIRLLQANVITTFVNQYREKIQKKGDVSVIICGDFNSQPSRSVYEYMTTGQIRNDHDDCRKIFKNRKCNLNHHFALTSACGTPTYTNYTKDFKGCLDYIFMEKNKMEVLKVIPITEEEELSKYEGLPNELFPSDHLALVTDIKLN